LGVRCVSEARRAPGRAFCPGCGQKYAVPEEELRQRPGLRFRATCPGCETHFSVRWESDGLLTETEAILSTSRGDDRDTLARGTRIGKYEIEELLATGGSAAVYRVFEMGANRTVALKILHQPPDSDFRSRFRREVEVQGNLKHPNVMPIFDQGVVDGKPYYTMELLHKPTTLETIVGLFRAGRLGYNAALRTLNSLEALLRQVLLPITRAIAFANAQGIVHRDLKPENVIVDARTLHVYVIDFGVCHLYRTAGTRLVLRAGEESPAEDLSGGAGAPARLTMGTPRFMPPEQARGEVHERGDVWALGALLRYLFTGDAPVAPAIDLRRVGLDKRIANLEKIAGSSRAAGDEEEAAFYERRLEELRSGTARTVRDILRDAQEGVYAPLPPAIDPALAAVIHRAMAPDPGARYENAGSFGQDIEAWLAGRPVAAYSAALGSTQGTLYRWRVFVRRNRTVVGISGTVIAAAILLVVFQLLRSSRGEEQRIAEWLRQAREAQEPATQEDRCAKVLALRPDHAEAALLLERARRLGPLKQRVQKAWETRAKVIELRRLRHYEAADRLADDEAAVLEGTVLPELLAFPADAPGRRLEPEARELADFLRGRRILVLTRIPDGVEVLLVPSRSRADPALLWEEERSWGVAPLARSEFPLDSGSYVLRLRRQGFPGIVHLPFVIDHATPPRLDLGAPLDPAALPEGMGYISGVPHMEFGDLRFSERTRRARVAPFLIDLTEVTNEQFARYIADLDPAARRLAVPHRRSAGDSGAAVPLWTQDPDGSWRFPAASAREPVTNISLVVAGRFAEWAGKRLPTPEEWELSARGFDQRDFPFGNTLDPSACNASTGMIESVASFPRDKSPFGIFDLAGNVAEWTAGTVGESGLLKGGSFELPRFRAIASSFERRRADEAYSDVGFRCARSLAPER